MQMTSILSLIPLDPTQRAAVTQRDADIIVTAGAGSGKTRTLVARFLALVEEGTPLRSLIAITFTDKAAREMRTRIGSEIRKWLTADGTPQPELWQAAFADLDSARIGTIHSLCAAILRGHPAEAKVDPDFEVLDENTSAALRAQAVQVALDWVANEADAVTLFALLEESELREMMTALLEKRASARAAFDAGGDLRRVWTTALARALARYTHAPEARDALATLRDLHARDELARAAGAKLAAQVVALLERWTRIETARAWDTRLQELFILRRECLGGAAGSPSAAKEAVRVLRETYDHTLDPWLGGKSPADPTPRWELDERAAQAMPQLRRAFDAVVNVYDALKAERRALDFDDLETQTVALLESNAAVRAHWQSETRAVLVDEFQDTNDFQRRLIYALSGFQLAAQTSRRTHLFIVGDGKQSIYRFRGGDVTVLRRVQADLVASGGKAFDLDLTYRAHEPLVRQLNTLLEPILGTLDDPARLYAIPFSPLHAHRPAPRDIREPFVEFCLGIGENTAEGRAAAAHALAARLRRMRDEGIAWGNIALLFRASTHFADYEAAFERANIPFVTVAGKGFYERPEVRDLLNTLAAIADPTDDPALAGALRSPAFGLSDGALYLLRHSAGTPRAFWSALHGNLSALEQDDAARAVRAREILSETTRLAGRVPIAAVLKHLLAATDYHAILRSAPDAERPRRNVDKLLADAHTSGLVSIGEFLEYVQTLRDVEAREGEAPVEAGKAVQLMTVHKAKGLEFPMVVIADAGHSPRGRNSFWLDPELGPLFPVRTAEERSVMASLAAQRDADQADAEERRLLYVAATRAIDKLLVCGHCRRKRDGTLTLSGWLDQLGALIGLDAVTVPESLAAPLSVSVNTIGGQIACAISPLVDTQDQEPQAKDQESNVQPRSFAPSVGATPRGCPIVEGSSPVSDLAQSQSLIAPLIAPASARVDEKTRAREAEPPPRVWRVVPTAQRPRAPAWVVGKLTHEALRWWRFPDRPDLAGFLYPHALAAGLTDRIEITATIDEARRLLARFQTHVLYMEMHAAQRIHEVPYTFRRDARVETGVIDVLYRVGDVWRLVDFKTDAIQDEEMLKGKIVEYGDQVTRYAAAVQALVGAEPQTLLCFLDMCGQVRVVAQGK
jgi:ATP-dependent helicase/nuclease subunit A